MTAAPSFLKRSLIIQKPSSADLQKNPPLNRYLALSQQAWGFFVFMEV